MKKLLAILVVATMLVSIIAMTPVMSAATADIVVQSGEGTAVIDGVKDAAYDTAQVLEFTQKGENNGNGEVFDTPQGYAYVINDAENVYVYFEVIDSQLNSDSANTYEQDSVEVFWMTDNSKVQWRLHYTGVADADTGTAPSADQWVTVETENGYVVECMFPITDVLDNQLEMCLQINACTDGARDCTIYIPGNAAADNAYQRSNRQTTYDVWWTLALTGEHEDTRVDPVEEADEITVKNYATIKGTQFYTQLFAQDVVSWGWYGVGSGAGSTLGQTVEMNWDAVALTQPTFDAENTSDWTKAPNYSIQVSCNGTMAAGDSAHYIFSVGDITITAEGYETVVVPAQELDCKWVGKEESWGISGTDSSIELGAPIREALGLSIQQFCEEYIPAISNINYTLTLDSYNLVTLEEVEAFEENLTALEQEWIDTDATLAEQLEKAQNALATAQGAPEDTTVLADALKDANNAMNRTNKARESAGWAEGGLADTYIKETFGGIVDEIQALVDAAAPAEPEPSDEPTDDAADTTAPAADNNSEGGSTGLVVGIIVAIVVIVVVVAAVVLGKKKK